MRIPKVISKNNREYIFVEQCNEKLFLYQEMLTGYKECFTTYDLGLVKAVYEKVSYINPEKVKFL